MKKLFSTQDVHPRDRFDYFHSVVSRAVLPHDSRPGSRSDFAAQIEADPIGELRLIVHENSPMDVSYGRTHISRLETDDFLLCLLLRGSFGVEQAGREAALDPGDMLLLDTRLPFNSKFGSDAKLLILMVPRCEIEARVGNTRHVLGRSLEPQEPTNGLTASFLGLLPSQAGRLSAAAEHMVRSQCLDLVALSLAQVGSDRPKGSSARQLAVFRVQTAIERGLTDPGLNADKVASAAGVSVRYANLLLAEQGTSIRRLILTTRLDRCRKSLADPLQVHRCLNEIAYAWGFTDMTHFGRSFRKLYGLLPSEYRRLMRAKISPTDEGVGLQA